MNAEDARKNVLLAQKLKDMYERIRRESLTGSNELSPVNRIDACEYVVSELRLNGFTVSYERSEEDDAQYIKISW